MASRDTAMRRVSEGFKTDCLLAPLSVIGADPRETSSGRPKASSSRLCSDLKSQSFSSNEECIAHRSSTSSSVASIRWCISVDTR